MPQTLAQLVRAKHPGAYDDLNDQDLESRVIAKYPGVYDDLPRTGASDSKGQRVPGDSFGDKIKNAASMLGSVLPAAGGMIGGALGGIPGAAAGGAAGEGYRELGRHVAEIPGAVADVTRGLIEHPAETARGFLSGATHGGLGAGEEAALQAAGQGVGNVAVKAAGGVSKWLMNRATSRVTERVLRDFPELSDTLIDHALTVSKGGYAKAFDLLTRAKVAANAALKASEGTVPIQMTPDLAESLKTAVLEKAVKAGKVAPMAEGEALTTATQRLDPSTASLFQRAERAAEGGGKLHLTAEEADVLKTQLQKESRALYANRTAPNGQKAMGMDATERAEFASRLNDAIDAIAPGYKAANAEARPLIGAVRGIKQATRANGSVYQSMVRPGVGMITGGLAGQREGGTPGAAVGAAVGGLATSPLGMSAQAIALSHPALQQALKQMPRFAAAWLEDLLASQQDQR